MTSGKPTQPCSHDGSSRKEVISIADKKFRGRDKIVQKMTKDGLVDENLRTGEQKSATAEEKPEQEDSAKETAKKEADEEPIVDEERCMDAGDGEEDAPRHHSTAKQSADYYKAHQEDGKPKDAPAEADVEPQTKKGRLSFEDEKGGIVRGVGMGVKKVAKKGVDTATGFAHQKVHQVEKDNSGVEAAHKSEEAAERLHHFVKGRKKPKDKSARAEKRGGEDQKSSRLKFSESEGGTAENAAEPSLKKKQPQPPPTAAGGEAKTVGAKFYQKKQYKDAYAAAKRGQKAGTAASKQAAAATNTITEKAKAAVQEIVVQNKTLWVSIGVGILLVMVMLGAFSSCGAAIQGTGSTFVGTTYPSKDADMKGAEEDYQFDLLAKPLFRLWSHQLKGGPMGKKLQKYLDEAEKTEQQIAELEERLRTIRAAQKKEEDSEIIRAIRSTKMGGRELLALLDNIQAGNVTFLTAVNNASEEAETEEAIEKDA